MNAQEGGPKHKCRLGLGTFLVKGIILFIIIAALFLMINMVVLGVAAIYKDGAAQVCEMKRVAVRKGLIAHEPRAANVLFMGNSRILAGIVPRQFDALAKGVTRSWNLALPALPISCHYFQLRDYLRRNPAPEFIVLKLAVMRDKGNDPQGLFNYYACEGMTIPDELVSYLWHCRDKTVVVNYVHPIRRYYRCVRRSVKDLWAHGWEAVAASRKRNSEILAGVLEDRGYYFIREQAAAGNERLPDDFVPEAVGGRRDVNLKADPYVKMFFDLTAEKDIKVLLIEFPTVGREDQGKEETPAHYRQLMKDYHNVFTATSGWVVKKYAPRYFADPTHVNREGARRFTKEVFDEFHEVFGKALAERQPGAR